MPSVLQHIGGCGYVLYKEESKMAGLLTDKCDELLNAHERLDNAKDAYEKAERELNASKAKVEDLENQIKGMVFKSNTPKIVTLKCGLSALINYYGNEFIDIKFLRPE